MIARSKHDDLSDLPDTDISRLLTSARSSIHRIAGRDSPYTRQCEDFLGREQTFDGERLVLLGGVVESLAQGVEAGHLKSVEELIHASLFADFLEMGLYLLETGYKDAAAVVIGSTLECHLRQICEKNGLETEVTSGKQIRAKKAELMNADLAKASVHSKLDQKSVTAWLDIRNNAAHGRYADYTSEQVSLMVAGIRDYITRHPA